MCGASRSASSSSSPPPSRTAARSATSPRDIPRSFVEVVRRSSLARHAYGNARPSSTRVRSSVFGTSSSASSSASSARSSRPSGKKVDARASRRVRAFASASRRRLRPTRSREAIHSATSAAPPPSPRAHEARSASSCAVTPNPPAARTSAAARARTFFSSPSKNRFGERLVSGRGSTPFRKPASSPRALRGRPRFVSPGTAPRAMNPATSGNVVLFLATRPWRRAAAVAARPSGRRPAGEKRHPQSATTPPPRARSRRRRAPSPRRTRRAPRRPSRGAARARVHGGHARGGAERARYPANVPDPVRPVSPEGLSAHRRASSAPPARGGFVSAARRPRHRRRSLRPPQTRAAPWVIPRQGRSRWIPVPPARVRTRATARAHRAWPIVSPPA